MDFDPSMIDGWMTDMAKLVENPETDVEEIVFAVDIVQGIKSNLAILESICAAALAKRTPWDLPPEDRHIPGIGTYEVHGGGAADVKYDNPMVLSSIAARLADEVYYDRETGEARPPAQVVADVVNRMAEFTGAGTAGFKAWRKTPAKKIGLNLSAFELSSEGKKPYTVRIIRD